MRCITRSVAANHPHKAGRAEEGLEVAMAFFVAHAESGFLVCALRRDVADQDCKLRDVVAVCMAGFENLGHQGVDQSAAPELGNSSRPTRSPTRRRACRKCSARPAPFDLPTLSR